MPKTSSKRSIYKSQSFNKSFVQYGDSFPKVFNAFVLANAFLRKNKNKPKKRKLHDVMIHSGYALLSVCQNVDISYRGGGGGAHEWMQN